MTHGHRRAQRSSLYRAQWAEGTTDAPRGLRIFAEGFSLHAGVSVSELEGDSLERIARYCAYPIELVELSSPPNTADPPSLAN